MPFPLRPVPSGCDETFDWSNVRPIVPLKVPPTPKADSRTEMTPCHSCLEDWNSRETTPMDETSIASGPTSSREYSTSPASPRIAAVQDTRAKRRKDRAPAGPYSKHTSSTPSVHSFSPSVSNPGSAIVDVENGLYRPFLGLRGAQLLRHDAVERTFSSEQRTRLAEMRRTKLFTRTNYEKLPCPLCDATSASTTALIKHLHSWNHLRVRGICDFCGAYFAVGSLADHVANRHPEREKEFVQIMGKRKRPVFEELDE